MILCFMGSVRVRLRQTKCELPLTLKRKSLLLLYEVFSLGIFCGVLKMENITEKSQTYQMYTFSRL